MQERVWRKGNPPNCWWEEKLVQDYGEHAYAWHAIGSGEKRKRHENKTSLPDFPNSGLRQAISLSWGKGDDRGEHCGGRGTVPKSPRNWEEEGGWEA